MEVKLEFAGKNGTVVSLAHTDDRRIVAEPGKEVLGQAEVVRYGNAGVIHSILRGKTEFRYRHLKENFVHDLSSPVCQKRTGDFLLCTHVI